jgi:hypothetical protein
MGLSYSQPRVDPVNVRDRMIIVVPMIGSGKFDDPKRPLLMPANGNNDGKSSISFSYVLTDDKQNAIVLLTADDAKDFKSVAADARVTKAFSSNKDKAASIEQELKKLKKDFDLESFVGRIR